MDGYEGKQGILPFSEFGSDDNNTDNNEEQNPSSTSVSDQGQDNIPDSLKYDPPSKSYENPDIYQEVVPDTLKTQGNEEDPQKAAWKISRTEDLLKSWNLDAECLPFVELVAQRRGFDSILRMNIKEERFLEQITEVKSFENVFANGIESDRVRYIPVGAAYVPVGTPHAPDGFGLLMLHQEVDSKNDQLGNTFYITRYVVVEDRWNSNYVDVIKIDIKDRDLSPDEKTIGTDLHRGYKLFPYERNEKGLPKLDSKGNLVKNYKIVPIYHYTMSYKINNNIREFVSTKKPKAELLAEAYALTREKEEIPKKDEFLYL